MQQLPPKFAQKLLSVLVREDLIEEVLGDLEEKFNVTLKEKSLRRARLNYWYQVFHYLRSFALRRAGFTNSINLLMIQHHIKISWRTVLRQKMLSSIKVGGLALGIAACILMTLFVRHEISYDQHYKKADRIFRITNQWDEGGAPDRWTNLHGPLKQVIEAQIPELDKVARTVRWTWGNAGSNHIRRVDSKFNLFDEGFIYADQELLEILEIPMIYGTRAHALNEPNTVVISRKVAEKFFPDQNPVGLQMILNDNPVDVYTVGGVMENFPLTSHLRADYIMTLYGRKSGPGTSGWCCTNYVFYALLKPGGNKVQVEEKLVAVRDTYVMDQLRNAGETGPDLEEIQQFHSYYLQPVGDIYLNPDEVVDENVHGSMELVYVFGSIAFIILLLASANFINISTARSISRARGVGIRKIVGIRRRSLIWQYLVESFLYCTLAFILAILLALAVLPIFNSFASKSLSVPWTSAWFIPSLLLGVVLIGLVSGIYPALTLSGHKPLEVMRGNIGGHTKSGFRAVMVVFQFTITVILIIGALVMHQQFELIMNKSLGYERQHVIHIQGINTISPEGRRTLKNEILKVPSVESATLSDYLPTVDGNIQNRTFWLDGRKQIDHGFEAARWAADEDYFKTMGMEIIAGRGFTKRTEDRQSIVINESMSTSLGLDDPIGETVIDMFDQRYRVIGVVKNFYFESVLEEIRPLAIVRGEGSSLLSVKSGGRDITHTLASIESVWNELKPHQAFRYMFMEQRYKKMYDTLTRAKTIFLIFSVLSIVIACLGLFALSTYLIEQRSKEVSVRKVLGASNLRIFTLLSKNFLSLVALSIIFAIPIGRYFMDELLGDTANRVELSWVIFAISGLLAITIALITISFETVRAARANPATKLRSE